MTASRAPVAAPGAPPMARVRVPDEVASLAAWVDAGVLGAAEVHVAAWVTRAAPQPDPLVVLGTALAVWAAQHGHTCVDLAGLADAIARDHAAAGHEDEPGGDGPALPPLPAPEAWTAALVSAPSIVRTVTGWDPEPVLDQRPLVCFGTRLYLQRHWMDECAVAAAVRARAVPTGHTLAPGAAALLEHLLPAQVDGGADLQRIAADLVVRERVAVIAGGPGTGKTYTVARLLATLLADADASGGGLRVALAAPTGKAAARLRESIGATLGDASSAIPHTLREALAEVVPTTVHRLLGWRPGTMQRFAHDASDPLPHDIVVVDETSMVALPLLARLVEALRPDARLVLVGDPDQLESVELGAVLADLVAAGERGTGPLAGRVVRLVRGHRFGGASPVARLAEAVRRGDEETTLAVLREQPSVVPVHGHANDDADGDANGDADTGGCGSVRFLECDDPRSALAVEAVRATVGPVLAELAAHARAGRADEALAALARARVLCAHRRGPFGVSTWNRLGEQWLTGSNAFPGRWYPGRPLLVTRNDPRLGLVNGHTGVVVLHDGRPLAVFATPGGLLPVVRLEPAQLDDVETAYAMTIHKSQGSEYPAVVVILPPATSPLVGRELLYTAVTRARADLLVVGSADAVRVSVRTPARRMSGLADALS